MWNEILAGVYFCGLAIFCVLRELIFAIRTDWFFLVGINFCDFRKYPVPSIDNIFVFIDYVQKKYIFSNNTKGASVFVSEKKRPVVIEQTRFLGTLFLSSEFKLGNTIFPLE